MGEIITLITALKEFPATVTAIIALVAIFITFYLRIKDADIQGVTTLSKVQNEKLITLMNQNEQLLTSVSTLQSQVQTLHSQMNSDADEHRARLEQTYKSIDEMRHRITELEDLVRHYQINHEYCSVSACPNRK